MQWAAHWSIPCEMRKGISTDSRQIPPGTLDWAMIHAHPSFRCPPDYKNDMFARNTTRNLRVQQSGETCWFPWFPAVGLRSIRKHFQSHHAVPRHWREMILPERCKQIRLIWYFCLGSCRSKCSFWSLQVPDPRGIYLWNQPAPPPPIPPAWEGVPRPICNTPAHLLR